MGTETEDTKQVLDPKEYELTDEDIAEWEARMEERADGVHHDSLYWGV